MQNKYKHLFFDMDGTLTRSRSLIAPEMKEVFNKLQYDTVIISGAQISQIDKQVGDMKVNFKMGQNGNQTFESKKELWQNQLSDEERKEIMEHIHYVESIRDWDVENANDLIEDRKSQISYSFVGHHDDVSKKEAFDPSGDFRKKMLDKNPRLLKQTEVKVAGTTCYDYFRKNQNKGTNVLRLIEEQGWNKEECVYFGDALYPGGNDEAVLGVIDVEKVKNEADTLKILKERYANS